MVGSESRKPVTVALIDGHALLHDAVRSLLADRDDMVLTTAETSAVRGFSAICTTKPDVVVIDASLPDMDGLVLAERILREQPAAKVVMLTMQEADGPALRAFDVGVKAYVFKRSPVDQVVQAITIAAQGGTYIDPIVAPKLLGDMSDSSGSLTYREADVVRRVALGYLAAEVADQIGVSAKSVRTYRARACHKLGLRTRAELFHYAREQNWLGSRN